MNSNSHHHSSANGFSFIADYSAFNPSAPLAHLLPPPSSASPSASLSTHRASPSSPPSGCCSSSSLISSASTSSASSVLQHSHHVVDDDSPKKVPSSLPPPSAPSAPNLSSPSESLPPADPFTRLFAHYQQQQQMNAAGGAAERWAAMAAMHFFTNAAQLAASAPGFASVATSGPATPPTPHHPSAFLPTPLMSPAANPGQFSSL